MHVSEARIAANRANSLKSCGPKSDQTKAVSRRNSCRHSLSGDGSVVPDGDVEVIRARVEALTAEMRPQTAAGAILIGKMATLSVRMERAAEHEAAAIALKVRHAPDDFDDERFDQANTLFETLADDPRAVLRKLKRMPEGVEKLIEAWSDLRADLANDAWSDESLEQAANLAGLKSRHARGSRFGTLTRAMKGDFAALSPSDGAGLGDPARMEWAKAALVGALDAEIAALEARHETLDFETLAVDRAEAGSRALFDTSKPACLARRYESEARRGFFKALKEFRQVEAEFAAQSASISALPAPRPPAPPEPKVGSFGQTTPTPPREPVRPEFATPTGDHRVVLDRDGQPLRMIPTPKTPG